MLTLADSQYQHVGDTRSLAQIPSAGILKCEQVLSKQRDQVPPHGRHKPTFSDAKATNAN